MRTILACGLAALLLAAASPVSAQRPDTEAEPPSESDTADRWYHSTGSMKVDPLQVHMQKAAIRSMHRRARIASMNWYGMSASRPMASATPHTSLYSPQWQMPGGRPFAWYPRSRTSTVYIYR